MIVLSICWGVRIYLKTLESQLEYLKDWEKIFRLWREWITRFSSSVDELISQTVSDTLTADLGVAKEMKGKTINDLLSLIQANQKIQTSDKQVIAEVLKNIGNSMVECELESLSYTISKLQILIVEREKTLKERKGLIFKLTPLLCGALAIILW